MARKAKHHEPVELPDHDSDEWVEIYPAAGLGSDTARALLDAARAIGLDEQRAVLTVSGGFRVPQAVIDAADLPEEPTDTGRHTAPTPAAALQQGAVADSADATE